MNGIFIEVLQKKNFILLPQDFLDGTGVFHFDMGGVVYF